MTPTFWSYAADLLLHVIRTLAPYLLHFPASINGQFASNVLEITLTGCTPQHIVMTLLAPRCEHFALQLLPLSLSDRLQEDQDVYDYPDAP